MTPAADTGDNSTPAGQPTWLSTLPDAGAFAAGLIIAWHFDWQVRDLVWSLWLSSLLVGYSIIVWRIFGPAICDFIRPPEPVGIGGRSALAGIRMFGGLFLLAFFTVHFGGFHYVHSMLLNHFFPVLDRAPRGVPSAAMYLHVLRAYWPFAIVAAVAERNAFRIRAASKSGDAFMVAYTNVIRMHMLIFFFFFAHLMGWENFSVYAFVYAVYFFPWRMLRRHGSAASRVP
jgi:hypothetical protein